ncbi:tetratricopeptide repeat protein [Vulgatibacter incomptus]|uniref:TPR domain protein, putative component of TonB system n=1 Tax=Vulgatibacter incomptus TaxID=1391653 RepID=A0A0K1P9F2_9BACT|nr:tetratricopeptide repeat protein [Vulgatibacter incomptus]AKU90168.1 TPR domain protein, putative component of TonB system [Vulgatibacter incomptus]
MIRRLAALSSIALLSAAGCAASSTALRPGDPAAAIQDEIEGFNEEELFACGAAAYQADDFVRAAACFSRLADRFPKSRRAHDAQYNAGVSYENLGAWQLALDRYRPLLKVPPPSDDLDVLWRVATCQYQLGEYDEAIALLEPVAARADLPAIDRIHARTHAAICKVEKGELSTAERDLRQALELYRRSSDGERIESYFPSQAQFFLGEIYRLHFSDAHLDDTDDAEKVRDQLEYKAQLLLSAQGHYLRTMRLGNPHWTTAAGQRVGGLYEELYDEMMEAPVPSNLDADQANLYRAMLRRKVRILVQKAISLYERTLAAAERSGVDTPFIAQTRESLDRMKRVLLADAARDEEDGVEEPPASATIPADADPGA